LYFPNTATTHRFWASPYHLHFRVRAQITCMGQNGTFMILDGAWPVYYRENNLLHLTLLKNCQTLRGEWGIAAPKYDGCDHPSMIRLPREGTRFLMLLHLSELKKELSRSLMGRVDHCLPLRFCPSSSRGESVGACDKRATNCVSSDCSLSHDFSCSKYRCTKRASGPAYTTNT